MSKTLADILRSYIPDGDGYNSEYAHNLNAAADALESQQSAPAGWRDLMQRVDDFLYALDETDEIIALRGSLCTALAAAPKAETVHDQQADRIADLERLLLDARGFVEAYVKNTFFGPNARNQLIKIDAALKGTTV